MSAQLANRVRLLPQQLDRARRRVAMLEAEAARLGMRWISEPKLNYAERINHETR